MFISEKQVKREREERKSKNGSVILTAAKVAFKKLPMVAVEPLDWV